jgi:cell division protein FtsW (lipid II flippase)
MPALDFASQSTGSRGFLIAAILAGVLLPLSVYQFLPMLGLDLSDILTPMNLVLLFVLGLLGTGYIAYLYYVNKTPALLSLGHWLLYPWLGFTCHTLALAGIGLSMNLLLISLFVIPAILIGFLQVRSVWNRVPYIKLYIAFMFVMLLYYFFYQEYIMEQRYPGGQFTLGFYYSLAMISNLGQIVLITIADKKPFLNQPFLKFFNWGILLSALLIAVVGIVGYPFEHFNIIDNFTRRARSIFYHPAFFAHYMAFCIIYLLGRVIYYKDIKKDKRLVLIFGGVCLVSFVSFMLAISKTAIFVLFATVLVMFFLNTSSWAKFLQQVKALILIAMFSFLAIWGYETYSGNPVLSSVMQRLDESGSMDWRERMNRYLTADVNLESIWLGHGMSAAKLRMSMFEGFIRDVNDPSSAKMKVVHVHNSYLSQIYDYGLIGLSLLIFLGIFAIRKFITILKTPGDYPTRCFNITIVGLIFYFMLVCTTETIFELPESPFWVLLTATVLAEGRVRRQWT